MFFKKTKCFTRQCFSIRNVTYNTQETCLFDASCLFLSTSNFFATMPRKIENDFAITL